jgi:hypothetical protein
VIEQVKFGAPEAVTARLQAIHEAAIYALASKVSRHPRMCAAVRDRFAALERACVTDRLLHCTGAVPALRLPPR